CRVPRRSSSSSTTCSTRSTEWARSSRKIAGRSTSRCSIDVSAPLPPLIGGKYRPLRELGRGGMGVVYAVEHVHTGEELALKLLLGATAAAPAVIDRFRQEARASARIKSENVVRVTDADVAPELGGAPFLVMELLEGEDLERATRASRLVASRSAP